MLYVTVGTGISSTFVIDGVPWPGARGNALVLSSGDLAVIDTGTGEVVRSVLEEWAAGPALVARYEERGGQRGLATHDLLHLAGQGDLLASRVVGHAAEALGSAIGQAVNLLDPHLVVIGGGLGLAGGSWWERIVAAARRSIWSEETRSLPIVPARLGTAAGIVGAALAVGLPLRC
jgi:glucokinase